MPNEDQTIVSTLNGLIETCRDGEIGYRDAADGVKDAPLKTLFQQYSQQRTHDITELQAEVSNHGGDPQKGGSLAGAVHRGWLNLKAAVTKQDDKAILDECERGEDIAVKAYKDSLDKPLPAHVQQMLQRQYNDVKAAHDRIRGLRDSYKLANTK